MSKIVLIGKDLPDGIDFAEALASSENTIFTTAKTAADTTSFESENIFATLWNKSSAISAHSMLINAETKLDEVNHVVIYFDSDYFCTKFELDKTEEISAAVDLMMNSYFYACSELLKRIDQKKEDIVVTFLLKEYPSKSEVLLNSSKTGNILPASSIVSAAEATFFSLAQNFATYVSEREYLSVILGRCSYGNELYKSERQIAQWVNEAYTTITSQKNHQNVKNACNWNKVGSKLQTGFSLFGR